MSDQVFAKSYAEEYDLLYGDKDYEAECDLLQDVIRRYGDGNVSTILDLGCGTGNHAIPLAQRGYQVTGVDRSAEMLAAGRKKAAEAAERLKSQPLAFLEGDVRSLELNQTFDAVLMMFAVLGYQLENDDVLAALRTVRAHLRPGGLFICDVWYGPAVLTIRPSDRVKVIPTEEGKLIRAASGELDLFHHRSEVRYHLWRLNGAQVVNETEEAHHMRYFFPQEIALFFDLAQLRLVDLRAFDDLAQPPDDTTWNVLVVGEAIQGERGQ